MGKVRFSLPLAFCGGRVHNSGQGHHNLNSLFLGVIQIFLKFKLMRINIIINSSI